MNFLKGLLISLLSLVLFLAISTLGFAFMLNQTVMDPNFTAAEIDRLDIAAVIGELVPLPDSSNDASALIPSATIKTAVTASIKEAEPALKNEIHVAIIRIYDYLLGRSNSLTVSISLEPLKASLKPTLLAELKKSPPAQIDGVSFNSIPPAQVDSKFNTYFDQSTKGLFNPLEIDSGNFPLETQNTIRDIRQGIAYYQFWWVTIPLILLLAVAIILLEDDLRASLLKLGFNLFVFGALGIAFNYLMKPLAWTSRLIPGLPAAVQVWVGQLIDDIFAPLTTFSVAVGVVGVLLIAGSFLVRKKEKAGA